MGDEPKPMARNTPTVIPTTGLCASCSFPVVRLGPDAKAWAERASAIEQAAHALCDAVGPGGVQDARPEVVAAMERLGLALARET